MDIPHCKHPEGCSKPTKTSGWCGMHYQRVWLTGNPGPVGSQRIKGRVCKHPDGCPEPAKRNGYCNMHAHRLEQGKDLGPVGTYRGRPALDCKHPEGCPRPALGGRGWCRGHYLRLSRTGEVGGLFPEPLPDAPEGYRTCRRCRQVKPVEEFYESTHRYWCKPCHRADSQIRKYGIAVEEGAVCAICGTSERLVIDHDKDTGVVRGIVCGSENSALGLFGHDPSRLRAAAAYLETWGIDVVFDPS